EDRAYAMGGARDPLLVTELGQGLEALCSKESLQWRRMRAECGLFTALRGTGGVRLKAARRLAVEGFNCGSELCGVLLGTGLGPVASDLGRSFRDEALLDADAILVADMDQ
ncbi:MAG: hypothetical protein ACI4NA_01550, partial [Succinivibrio sp.]